MPASPANFISSRIVAERVSSDALPKNWIGGYTRPERTRVGTPSRNTIWGASSGVGITGRAGARDAVRTSGVGSASGSGWRSGSGPRSPSGASEVGASSSDRRCRRLRERRGARVSSPSIALVVERTSVSCVSTRFSTTALTGVRQSGGVTPRASASASSAARASSLRASALRLVRRRVVFGAAMSASGARPCAGGLSLGAARRLRVRGAAGVSTTWASTGGSGFARERALGLSGVFAAASVAGERFVGVLGPLGGTTSTAAIATLGSTERAPMRLRGALAGDDLEAISASFEISVFFRGMTLG